MKLMIIAVALAFACSDPPIAKNHIPVFAEDFKEATRVAVELLNVAAGCKFLVKTAIRPVARGAIVMSANGSPCGITFHPNIEDGHSAGAYRCTDGSFEVQVERPGDLRTQACIVTHELGHIAGLKDKPGKGIMDPKGCGRMIRVSDAERALLADRFCD